MITILVTGAAGAVGSITVQRLRAAGYVVVGFDQSADPGHCDRYVQGDLTDQATLRVAMAGCQRVIHLAANPSTHADFLTQLIQPNIIGTWNVFEVAHELQIQHVVFASSINAMNGPISKTVRPTPATLEDPGNPYGLSKLFGEHIAGYFQRVHKLSSTCARLVVFPRSPKSIGYMLANPPHEPTISHDDWLRFLEGAWTSGAIYAVVPAMSPPRQGPWHIDPEHGRQVINFYPVDEWLSGYPPEYLNAEPYSKSPRPEPKSRLSAIEASTGDPKHVLITGAAGQIANVIIPHLQSLGFTITGIDTKADPGWCDHYVQGSISDRTAVDAAIADCGNVIHLAADPHPLHHFLDLLDPNIRGAWTLLEAAHAQGVRRFVAASSLHAGGAPDDSNNYWDLPIGPDRQCPTNMYGLTKLFFEHALRLYHRHTGLSAVALRLGWFARSDREARYILQKGPQYALSTEDCCQAFARALMAENIGFERLNVVSLTPEGHEPVYAVGPAGAAIGFAPVHQFPNGTPWADNATSVNACTPTNKQSAQ